MSHSRKKLNFCSSSRYYKQSSQEVLSVIWLPGGDIISLVFNCVLFLHPNQLHLVRQEGKGQGTVMKRMTQQLAPRWWEIHHPVDLELQYTLTEIQQHAEWHSHRCQDSLKADHKRSKGESWPNSWESHPLSQSS